MQLSTGKELDFSNKTFLGEMKCESVLHEPVVEFCMAKLNFQGKMKRNCCKSWGSMEHGSNFEMQHLMFECFLMIFLMICILFWLKQNELIFSRSQRKTKNSDQLRNKSCSRAKSTGVNRVCVNSVTPSIQWTCCVNPVNFHAPISVSLCQPSHLK